MPSHTYRAQTSQPPDLVFDYMADLRHASNWVPMVSTVQRLDDGPEIGLGSRFLARSARVAAEYEIVEFDRPRRIVWKVTEPRVKEATDTYTLTPTARGTEIEYRTEFELGGVLKLTQPLSSFLLVAIDARVAKNLESQLARLP